MAKTSLMFAAVPPQHWLNQWGSRQWKYRGTYTETCRINGVFLIIKSAQLNTLSNNHLYLNYQPVFWDDYKLPV